MAEPTESSRVCPYCERPELNQTVTHAEGRLVWWCPSCGYEEEHDGDSTPRPDDDDE